MKHYINIEQNITVELPYNMAHKDENFKVENDDYFFDLYMNQSDSTIKISYTYRNLSDHIEGDKLKTYIKDVKKIDEYLTYTLNRGTINTDGGFASNIYMVMVYVLSLALTALICFKLYTKNIPFQMEEITNALSINGWLVVLAIRVVLFPFSILVKPFTIDLFDQQLWINLSTFYDAEIILKAIFIIESICFAGLLVYSVFCAVLFFQRRKEFPKHFIILSVSYCVFAIFDWIAGAYINKLNNIPSTVIVEISGFMGSILFSIIATLYLIKSTRVKQTFVFTYPKAAWQAALSDYYNNLFTEKKDNNHENI